MSYISVGTVTRDHRGTSSPDADARYEKECRDAGVHDSRISACVSARRSGTSLSRIRNYVDNGDWGTPRPTDRNRKSGTAYKGSTVVGSRSPEEQAELERIRKARAEKLERLRKSSTCRHKPGTVYKNWRTGKGYVADHEGCLVEDKEVTDEMISTVEEKGHPAERESEGVDPADLPILGGAGGIPPWLIWGGAAAAGVGLVAFLVYRRR